MACNFILAQYLNVALISAADREYKGKVRLRSLLKSQIPRPKRKIGTIRAQAAIFAQNSREVSRFFDDLLREHVGIGKVLRFFRGFRLYQGDRDLGKTADLRLLKKKVDTETSPSEHQIGGVTALARISDSLVNSSIVSFNV